MFKILKNYIAHPSTCTSKAQLLPDPALSSVRHFHSSDPMFSFLFSLDPLPTRVHKGLNCNVKFRVIMKDLFGPTSISLLMFPQESCSEVPPKAYGSHFLEMAAPLSFCEIPNSKLESGLSGFQVTKRSCTPFRQPANFYSK